MANKDIRVFGEQLAVSEAFGNVNYLEKVKKQDSPFKGGELLGADDQGLLQHNTPSLINKFTVFQYAPLNAGASYRAEGHFIGFSSNLKADPADYEVDSLATLILQRTQQEVAVETAGTDSGKAAANARIQRLIAAGGAAAQKAKYFKTQTEGILSNPTSRTLIDWGANKSALSTIGFQPYSHTDFMFCKYYGKIPNNRLITLRRYPYPIGDSLRLGSGDRRRNAIPIAQAVTWFGGETKNSISGNSGIGLFKWDIPWDQNLDAVDGATGQTIDGNEITLSQVLKALSKLNGGDAIAKTIEAAYAGFAGTDAQLQQLSGYEAKIIEYQKNLYDSTTGPYWNRIYGPVNVITKSSRRSRGLQTQSWQTSFTINFHYSFRSFNGISPKIAALDIISNFLNLTYQDAQFLGQLARYFPATGLKFDPTMTEAIGQILTKWGTTFNGNSTEEFSRILMNLVSTSKVIASNAQNGLLEAGKRTIQAGIMNKDMLGDAIPRLVSIKSALSDRPVGEWHLTVGNPMNPIFVMGDLICTETTMIWDEEIGPDDFPTGVQFQVTLKQGKPRDKTAIERMLNHGETKLTAGMLRTSAQDDTFGEANNKLWNSITDTENTAAKLEETYNKMSASSKKGYTKFRDRFLTGYGMPALKEKFTTDSPTSVDDSLLLMYYQRQYGNN
jgi:hypothetical protein